MRCKKKKKETCRDGGGRGGDRFSATGVPNISSVPRPRYVPVRHEILPFFCEISSSTATFFSVAQRRRSSGASWLKQEDAQIGEVHI